MDGWTGTGQKIQPLSKPALYHLPLESDAVDVQEVRPLAGGLLPGRDGRKLHVRNHGFL